MSIRSIIIVLATGVALLSCQAHKSDRLERPNILWITCEDISPYLGCYGDSNAVTPNLDKLASEGVLYTNAYANVPVCAPARNTILTGMYASSLGTHNMRSTYKIPEIVNPYPLYLREAGYYCTNNRKTDYNTGNVDKDLIWDESAGKAHYKNRKPGQPFFAIFNFTVSHESRVFEYEPGELVHDPDKMHIPPYHPDLPEVREDWAKFYDNITAMDAEAGAILEELEDLGLSENTIVIFYGDHGGMLTRSKRFIYNTGTRVPFIVKFPEKYEHLAPGKPGSRNDRLISFVDLVPTLLSLVDIEKPEYLQGKAFLGENTEKAPEYVYFFRGRMDERIDMMRGICNEKYRYIVNFMPHRPYGQHINYLWNMKTTRAWEKTYLDGNCNETQSIFWGKKPPEELYDMQADPWEVNNLAGDPQYKELLDQMRAEMKRHIIEYRDAGFAPESELYAIDQEGIIYDYAQSDNYPLEEILEFAYAASEENIPKINEALQSNNSTIRYWGAEGAAVCRDKSALNKQQLILCLSHESGDVAVAAAEALYGMNEKDLAVNALRTRLSSSNPRVQLHAVNVIDALGEEVIALFENDLRELDREETESYVKRIAGYLINKY